MTRLIQKAGVKCHTEKREKRDGWVLALCFCMYLGMRYRLAAFGFAVLAVRRLYDAIVLLMQGGHLLEALTDGCICVIFITLTLHMLRTYANSKNQADADETE